MNHFSLFTGIGGLDLAAEWAGLETVGQCEFADYPTKVLEKHWADVPRWRDIRDVTAESVQARGIGAIDVISGGFPCQPFSVAGKRRGKEDERYLFPEMLRVIRELRPNWVVGENVNGFVNMGLEDACVDLENEGYAVQAFVVPACAVQAWHERKRVFIIAHSKHNGRNETEITRADNGTQQKESTGKELLLNESKGIGSVRENTNIDRRTDAIFQDPRCKLWQRCEQQGTLRNEIGERFANITERSSEMVFNSTGERRKEINDEAGNIGEGKTKWESWTADSYNRYIWESEPNVGRVANGISSRLDRLKCLGNAVVPQQAYPIFKAIYDIEMMK